MPYYLVFFDLLGRASRLVGGGWMGECKAFGLLRAGAHVHVISPDLT